MSNSSNVTPAEQLPRRPYLALLLKVGAGLGVVIALGSIAGAIWGKRVINSQVMPLVEDRVADIIERPIDLGDVERLSLSGVQLGKTTLPSTATDESSVTVDQVSVGFDLKSLVFQKTFKPDIVLVRPDVSLVQSKDGQWFELSLPDPPEEEPAITTEIQTIKIQDARVSASTLIQEPNALVPRQPVEVTGADVIAKFSGEESKQVYFDLTGDVDAGSFDIKGEGDLENQAVKANLRVQDLPTTGVNILLPSLVGLSSGSLNTNLTVAAALTEDGKLDESSVDVQGTAQFRDGQVLVQDLPEPVSNIRSQLRFQGQRVTLENTELQVGDVALLTAGTVDWDDGYDLTAQIPEVSLADVQALAAFELPENLPVDPTVPFELNTQVTGELTEPNVKGRLVNIEPLQVDKVRLATVSADFVLPLPEFELKEFELTELRLVPEAGGVVLAQGQADLTDLKNPQFELTGQADLPVDPFTQLYGVTLPPEMVIGSLTAELEAEGTLEAQTAFAQWQLSESTFPGQGELTFADNRLVVDNTSLQVFGGTVTANAVAQLEGGAWQATVATDQVPVDQFTPQAQGLLSAELDAAGNLYEFDLATVQAGGRAAIANTLILIPNTNQPLLEPGDWTTAFQWQGDQIAIESFNAPGVQADGTIGIDFDQPIPIGDLNLNVALQQFDLHPLNNIAPANVRDYGQLAGLTSFNGQITGTLDNPLLAGAARLDNLALNDLVFEPLAGPISFSLAEGGSLDLKGSQDRLQLALDNRFWPVSFEVRNQEFVAQGYGEGNQIHADIVQLPLDKLNVRPAAGFGQVAGLLDASIDADLTDFANPMASGEVTIVQPTLAPVDAQQLAATFRYADNTATLEQGELLLDNSRYLLTGSASVIPQLQYEGELTVEKGRIEDLVALVEKIDLSVFRFRDQTKPEGSAADLAVVPAELPAGSLLEQLEAFVAFVESQPKDIDDGGQLVIPTLADLSGGFTGTIAVTGDSPYLNDVKATFDIQGDSWQWGPYAPPNEFVISGDVQELSVNFEPVLITAGETIINLSGNGDLEQLTGQLTVDNLPVELAEYIYPLPVAATGELDIFTQFDGSLANPIVEGEAIIVNPQINDYPIERVETNFSYRNASLDVAGDVAIDPDDAPITLRGTIPYALPFMTVKPSTERLAIKAVVPDDSFDVINTLSQDQVRWESGRGKVVVQVDGTLNQPVVTGNVKLRDGVVGSEFLEDPITDLTGDIQFDLTLLDKQFSLGESNIPRVAGGLTIPQLQANVKDGQLQVNGRLPLSPFDQPTDGIKITLGELPVNYSGTVKSIFDGQIMVDGSVIAPVIGGNLAIGAGKVSTFELASQFRNSNRDAAETDANLLRNSNRDTAEADANPQAADEPNNPIVRQMAKAVVLYREEFFGEENLVTESSDELPLGIVGQLVSFNGFEIQLSDRLLIEGQPLFNLRASGDIVVDGALANPRPEGEIELESGWINLFSTQFRLDRGEENKATFIPSNGIYPILNATMRTRVQETDTPRVPAISESGFVSSEVTDDQNIDALGSVEYVTIKASVVDLNARDLAQGSTGEAQDKLGQVVVLESDPSRGQGELISLLGNNVFSGITSAGLTQLAGFVGAGNVVGFLNNLTDAIGFQSFSVFPTTDTATDSTAGIGIGVEAIFEVTDDINVSVLEILNNGNAPQFGLQYELTEEVRLRGSSNLDDTEVRLEYRLEF
ncbi:translocation/assembly module TamB domain-containing protein [Leptothoe spongobia]|uniref:Translocation/assembly module TamB domain-containing protein n=1 Tax=Leptothoe spongobia TAU-MAC 1115 TaxID=1967444 RepID=A0A947DL30_9CYAN|nr:translocation/assembly module TamB domain-containing protein [Leptothoe spongobia]MBT9317616.1 translocation/assembly module TamB domain-containing protein [Leptothoe spongobia TAU-MAC 1115]